MYFAQTNLLVCVALAIALLGCTSSPVDDDRAPTEIENTDIEVEFDLPICGQDADCAGGELCRNSYCREACSADDPCAGALSACNSALGICVECVESDVCPGAERCSDGFCQFSCVGVPESCAEGQTCDTSSGRCVAPMCTDDSACSGGFRCADGLCTPIEDIAICADIDVQATLRVIPDPVDFARVPPGVSSTVTITATNAGSCTFDLTNISLAGSSAFDLTTPSGGTWTPFEPAMPTTLTAGQTLAFDITYHPTEANVDEATLSVEFRDNSERVVEVALHGNSTSNANLCPIAVASAWIAETTERATRLSAAPGDTIRFDANESDDPDGTITAYLWRVETAPDGSTVVFDNPTDPQPSVQVDRLGVYEFSLDVFDDLGLVGCESATVLVSVSIVDPSQAITVELFWDTPSDENQNDDSGTDLDLHFLHPSGRWNQGPWDCYYANREPMWSNGSGARLTLDDVNGAGPEIVAYDSPLGTAEQPIEYSIGVFYFSDHGYGNSSATVRIYFGEEQVFSATIADLVDRQFWDVARIGWPSGEVIEIDELYPSGFP